VLGNCEKIVDQHYTLYTFAHNDITSYFTFTQPHILLCVFHSFPPLCDHSFTYNACQPSERFVCLVILGHSNL
jgi:hypothetical protein